ncbi:carbohydrate kinase family protein [Mycolicibacterium sp. 120270]|uniref:carbohydrate kinase family protein n=1 Tax=Mycolicibacterium sp. 120270 TaxID=3090600 RepID=UPI00299E2F12|nr:PfkB family carbohydrate kinase [Mycolicibacterium sp. 120270]MDX1882060.1 PfkB family carbohydrate kinase [Mycolicibacterium sp. 120270]
MDGHLIAGVTVMGNLAIDVIDGAPPTPGGCASFAGVALAAVDVPGRLIAMGAERDHALFDDLAEKLGPMLRILPADRTSSFRLDYVDVDHRRMSVDAVGPVWGLAAIDAADPDTTWLHLAPLLRTDFPAETIEVLDARGHCIVYDGQGLVRADRVGPMVLDRHFSPELLRHISVLKLAEDEAVIVADGPFDESTAARLGVPEILVTYGSEGCDIYSDGAVVRVPAAWRVEGVQTTGAGDMFTACYAAHRAAGEDSRRAVELASELVASELEQREHIEAGHQFPAKR